MLRVRQVPDQLQVQVRVPEQELRELPLQEQERVQQGPQPELVPHKQTGYTSED